MGLWDRQIADLEALGIRFSDLEVSLLNYRGVEDGMGNYVLRLAPLPDPTSRYGMAEPMKDTNGEIVHVAEIIEVSDPYGSFEMYGFDGPKSYRMLDYMQEEHGALDSPFPSYFGLLTECSHDLGIWDQCMREETPQPYPFWTCRPLDEYSYDSAKRLATASEHRVMHSGFMDLMTVIEAEEASEGSISVEEMWLKVRYKRPMDEQSLRWWGEYLQDYGDRDQQRERVDFLMDCYDTMVEKGLAPSPDIIGDFEWRGLEVRPIEQHLVGQLDDFVALDLWNAVESRMRFMKARIGSTMGPSATHRMVLMEAI